MTRPNFCGRTRREFLWQTGAGFTGVSLAGLLEGDGFFAGQSVAADGDTAFQNPLSARPPHFKPKAKSVIFLYMYGGPSHMDTFDRKPEMKGMDGRTVEVKTFGRGGHRNKGRIAHERTLRAIAIAERECVSVPHLRQALQESEVRNA